METEDSLQPIIPFLRQMYPTYIRTSYFLTIRFNIILLFTHVSQAVSSLRFLE